MKPKDTIVIATLKYLTDNMGRRKTMGEALKDLTQAGYDVETPNSPDQNVFIDVFFQHTDMTGQKKKDTYEELYRIKPSAKSKLNEHTDSIHARRTRYATIAGVVIGAAVLLLTIFQLVR